MDYNISLENEYIPKWNGNRKLPPEKQCVVIWTWPTARDIEAGIQTNITEETKAVKVNFYALVERCVKIKNFNFNGKPIETGKDVLDSPGLSKLALELRKFMETKQEPDSKNS